jgi:hypothetical protein
MNAGIRGALGRARDAGNWATTDTEGVVNGQ